MDENHVHHPLLPLASHAATTYTATDIVTSTSSDGTKIKSSNYAILIRFLVILLIGVISVWANHEASKGFVIMAVNNMKNTPAGEKFTLFYISNDEAIRLVQRSSLFAAQVLFPGDHSIPEKLIIEVEIQLVSHNVTNDHMVALKYFGQKNKYVLSINPLVMEFDDFRYRIRKVIQRGMSEILLFNQQNRVPKTLVDGMVEYISDLAGFGSQKLVLNARNFSWKCWEDQDPRLVARFLAYGEKKSEGFVGRLNQEMNKDGWSERMMDKVLGMPAIFLCVSLQDSMINNEPVRI